ncbi:unnamed protein product [Symbiodinium sp. CCMP2592]|nr:unnamed protein product [Symbiodinium sp. CCMP2592]
MGLTLAELSAEVAFAEAQRSDLHAAGAAGPLSTEKAAAALLSGLFSPVALQWKTEIANGLTATVRAEVSRELTCWPPEWVHLTVSHAEGVSDDRLQRCLEIKVPSSVLPAQLDKILAGASFTGSNCEAEEASTSNLSDETMAIIDQCQARGISQPMSLAQWHHAVCGHHALFNLRCLLSGDSSFLQNEPRFWCQALCDIERLARHGETSGSWPRSRVTGGIADEVHLRHLVSTDPALSGRVSVASSLESLQEQLQLSSHTHGVHGFLLGGATHWYSAAVVSRDRLTRPGHNKIYFFDSYNTPLAAVMSNADIESMVEEQLCVSRTSSMDALKQNPAWAHKPNAHLETAFEEGVEEWWKGVRKASVFWQHKPLDVRRQLMRMDLQLVRDFLRVLADAYCSA